MYINLSSQVAFRIFFRIVWILVLLTACRGDISSTEELDEINNNKLKVVASTSIVFDVARQVGGDSIDLNVLLPIGTDPHSFEPTPQDIKKLSDADVLFINGVGLESFIDPLIESSGGDFMTVDLSRDLELIELEAPIDGNDDHGSGNYDPHVWMDPKNVMLWVKLISESLSSLDPVNSSQYMSNANSYIEELEALDRWIVDQVKKIPPGNKNLITDHLVFGYFAKRFGFIQVGAVLPSFSTQSQSSAQEIAVLEDTIQNEEIKAIFVSTSVNPDLAQRIAEDTGIELVYVHTGSITEAGGPADNYLDLMRYDVIAIVTALQ